MFSCTPRLTKKMYRAFEAGDYETAGKCLDGILALRNTFVSFGVFPAFTCAMNRLGYEGIFHPDYHMKLTGDCCAKVVECMKKYEMEA
jgi:4-hydroxy-tetrahydrodipicolinate synthase